jgi:hypothetical protein
MSEPDTYRITFLLDVPGFGLTAKMGWLRFKDGEAWAYARREDVGKPPDEVRCVQLDASRLVQETDPSTGEIYFAYGPEQ